MFPAFPWELPRVFPVKVTYKKSTKKNAKKYTKTYTCKTTVKNPTLAVSVKSKKLVIGDKMAIKTKKTPHLLRLHTQQTILLLLPYMMEQLLQTVLVLQQSQQR